ncbi:MAG: Trm112 family protein [Alphaproteobacteria bacterium]|nr:Trm112 family protein [Alphaproteobacteria bacterium]
MTENHEQNAVSKPQRFFDRSLLQILVCPLTKEPLFYDEAQQELISKKAALAYPIRDGIPVMLIDEARKIEK